VPADGAARWSRTRPCRMTQARSRHAMRSACCSSVVRPLPINFAVGTRQIWPARRRAACNFAGVDGDRSWRMAAGFSMLSGVYAYDVVGSAALGRVLVTGDENACSSPRARLVESGTPPARCPGPWRRWGSTDGVAVCRADAPAFSPLPARGPRKPICVVARPRVHLAAVSAGAQVVRGRRAPRHPQTLPGATRILAALVVGLPANPLPAAAALVTTARGPYRRDGRRCLRAWLTDAVSARGPVPDCSGSLRLTVGPARPTTGYLDRAPPGPTRCCRPGTSTMSAGGNVRVTA
jgi:hypothetical protein